MARAEITARDLISVQETNDADAREKFLGEGCFAAPLHPAMR
jgi:hypothetical protein